jgi:predicted dehydrogenase
MDKIKWGILGLGGIARQFAQGLHVCPDAELVAVGSRTQERADRFGDEFAVARRYSSYDELAYAQDIDVIYIATPHPLHAENTLLCLQAGKAVLCEKPFTMNAAQAQAVINFARGEQKFLMEAMWTRFLPAMVKVRELLTAGAIGEPLMLQADFGFRVSFDPRGRLFAPELGGGALLDMGIYVVSLASMLFGEPDRTTGLTQLGETGIDEHSAMVLGYPGGQLASLAISLRTATPQTATIMGIEGMIHIPAPWWKPTRLSLTASGKASEVIDLPFEGNGYNYEAEEVMRCLRVGKLESETMPLDETLAIMQTLDRIRAPWGIHYPME